VGIITYVNYMYLATRAYKRNHNNSKV